MECVAIFCNCFISLQQFCNFIVVLMFEVNIIDFIDSLKLFTAQLLTRASFTIYFKKHSEFTLDTKIFKLKCKCTASCKWLALWAEFFTQLQINDTNTKSLTFCCGVFDISDPTFTCTVYTWCHLFKAMVNYIIQQILTFSVLYTKLCDSVWTCAFFLNQNLNGPSHTFFRRSTFYIYRPSFLVNELNFYRKLHIRLKLILYSI